MFVCLLDELILGFCYIDLTLETGGFELASTITLVLQANRLTKCASHPNDMWHITHTYYFLCFFYCKPVFVLPDEIQYWSANKALMRSGKVRLLDFSYESNLRYSQLRRIPKRRYDVWRLSGRSVIIAECIQCITLTCFSADCFCCLPSGMIKNNLRMTIVARASDKRWYT